VVEVDREHRVDVERVAEFFHGLGVHLVVGQLEVVQVLAVGCVREELQTVTA